MSEMNQAQERTWGMVAHLAALAGFIIPLGNIIGPLIVWLIKKDESSWVDEQGKESINFQISITIYCIVAALLIVIVVGIILLIGLAILDVVLIVIAAVKTNSGEKFRYPLSIKFIR